MIRRAWLSAFALLLGTGFSCLAQEIDFNRDIRPILSENCYTCHGPDAAKRKGKLRLDVKDSAFGEAKSGARAIVPGDLEKSELVQRITTDDTDDVMPPTKEHKQLRPAQVDLIKRWISAGAVWLGHWSFLPIKSPAVPPVHEGWISRNPIDAFIQQRLTSEGLSPSPESGKAALIRRASLDLTGLPPTIQEVDAFLADAEPTAFEKVVDRLLASPHFGERMAVPWLDLARYGDTSGYHNDSLRTMWLWRDWVIQSFNDNKPFDAFTVEQIAGDMLPGATVDQQVASGFHRNVMTTDEGGIIPAEYLSIYIVDRVNTTGLTWLGLTTGCAQCHDHKYDPLTQKEYYQFYSFFHNIPESGLDGVRDRNPKPYLLVPKTDAEKALVAQVTERKAAAEKEAGELRGNLQSELAKWLLEEGAKPSPAELSGLAGQFTFDQGFAGTDGAGRPLSVRTAKPVEQKAEGRVKGSLSLTRSGGVTADNVFSFEGSDAFSVSGWMFLKGAGNGHLLGKLDAGPGYRGWRIELKNQRPNIQLIHQWPENATEVLAKEPLPLNQWMHFLLTFDGTGKAAGIQLYINNAPVVLEKQRDALNGTILTEAPFEFGGSVGIDADVDDVRIFNRTLASGEIPALIALADRPLLEIAEPQRTQPQKDELMRSFLHVRYQALDAAEKRIAVGTNEIRDLQMSVPNTMVMSELEKPRDTFIHVRGAYDQPGEKAQPGFPAFLPQLPALPDGRPFNRLDLAHWLVSPEQPLTARVAVNRWWAMLFGTGIVKTANDFGAQGEWPSHPELLEWLAADFMKDWDIKRCIKQVVMSATYRQSAEVSPELLARDAGNRLLAHGPRTRLDAEFIRDNALAIGGILNSSIGGRSFKPYQPPGIWEVNDLNAEKYVKAEGTEQYRRGLYVYWRRSTVYPEFITLDAPTREYCVAQRSRTSTPLQSLLLLNDPVYVEAARAYAQRVLKEGGPDASARLAYMWRLALAREPSEAERAILEKTLAQQLEIYRADTAAAEALLKTGDLPRPEGLDAGELAAWTAVGNVILNLNETITD